MYTKKVGGKIVFILNKTDDKQIINESFYSNFLLGLPYCIGSYICKLNKINYLYKLDSIIYSTISNDINVCPAFTSFKILGDESFEIDFLDTINKYDNNIPFYLIIECELKKICFNFNKKYFENTGLECEIDYSYDDVDSDLEEEMKNNIYNTKLKILGEGLKEKKKFSISIKLLENLKFVTKLYDLNDSLCKNRFELLT